MFLENKLQRRSWMQKMMVWLCQRHWMSIASSQNPKKHIIVVTSVIIMTMMITWMTVTMMTLFMRVTMMTVVMRNHDDHLIVPHNLIQPLH